MLAKSGKKAGDDADSGGEGDLEENNFVHQTNFLVDNALDLFSGSHVFIVGSGRTRSDVDAMFLDDGQRWARATLERERTHMDAGEPQEIDPPLRERLGQIEVATAVLVGAHDHPRMQEIAHRYADGIPGASLEVVEGTAHLPHVERPDVVAAAVRRHDSRS